MPMSLTIDVKTAKWVRIAAFAIFGILCAYFLFKGYSRKRTDIFQIVLPASGSNSTAKFTIDKNSFDSSESNLRFRLREEDEKFLEYLQASETSVKIKFTNRGKTTIGTATIDENRLKAN